MQTQRHTPTSGALPYSQTVYILQILLHEDLAAGEEWNSESDRLGYQNFFLCVLRENSCRLNLLRSVDARPPHAALPHVGGDWWEGECV